MAQKSREIIFQDIARKNVLSIVYVLEAQIKALETELEKAKKILEPEQRFVYEQHAEKELHEIGKTRSALALAKGKNAASGKLLTVDDVAQILSLTPKTIREYVKKSMLSAIILPGSHGGYRFKPEHIEGWLDKRTIKARSF